VPSPQLENGYVKIANELWDALCRTRIPGECRQVLDAIIRSWNKKADQISYTHFKTDRIVKAKCRQGSKEFAEYENHNVF
jgi:hypothetical protein